MTIAVNKCHIVGLGLLPMLFAPSIAKAQTMTAGTVLDRMGASEQSGFMAGIVEGLAYARMVRDDATEPGMKCIYDWFYRDESTLAEILVAFDYFRAEMPGAVIGAMVEQECGL